MPPPAKREAESAGPYSTIWERMAQDATRSRSGLTYERITRAALAIADEEGLAAVSMRRLAQRLEVATMATYRYVSGKDDVLQLMVDACHGEIIMDPAALSHWRTSVVSYAQQYRGMVLRHPWIVEVPELVPGNLTPHMAAVVEKVLGSLTEYDIDVDSKMAIVGSTTVFVHGACAAEVAEQCARVRHGWTGEDDVRSAHHPYMVALTSTGEHPRLVEYLVEGSNRDDGAWQFEFGLESLLEGMAARLGI